MTTTVMERNAVLGAIRLRQGELAAKAFENASSTVKDHRVTTIEESAALAAAIEGLDSLPRDAKAVFDAARDAGKIDSRGQYIGESTDAVAAKDPKTATNACC